MSAEEKSTEGNTEGTSDRLELGVSILYILRYITVYSGKRKFQPPMPTILNKTGKHKFKIEGLDSQSMELFSAFYKNPGESNCIYILYYRNSLSNKYTEFCWGYRKSNKVNYIYI